MGLQIGEPHLVLQQRARNTSRDACACRRLPAFCGVLSRKEMKMEKKEYTLNDMNSVTNQDGKTCGINDMNCLEAEEEKSCDINNMNCLKEDEKKSCGINNMNCEE